jgi:hypothetical protein
MSFARILQSIFALSLMRKSTPLLCAAFAAALLPAYLPASEAAATPGYPQFKDYGGKPFNVTLGGDFHLITDLTLCVRFFEKHHFVHRPSIFVHIRCVCLIFAVGAAV